MNHEVFCPALFSISNEHDGKVYQVYADRWWVTNQSGDLLFSRGNPICNRQKEIASSLRDSFSHKTGIRLEVKFVPIALVDVTASVWND